jgi:CHAD domain-containing protein
MRSIGLKEDFLHFIWKTKKFNFNKLKLTDGSSLQIKKFGTHNHNAGPDFLNATVVIDDKEWHGNIELHVDSSDWYAHKHDIDTAYNSVILHVSYLDNKKIYNSENQLIPCLELKELIDPILFEKYRNLENRQPDWIPCEKHLHKISAISKTIWLEKLLIERVEAKTRYIQLFLEQTNYDWEESFYRSLARVFGSKVNQDAFELLAFQTPSRILRKHLDNPLQVNAMVYGQSGLLEGDDTYVSVLKKEYDFLAKKYDLKPISKALWKFSRMRPANMPPLRLAQFASVLLANKKLFAKVIAIKNYEDAKKLFITSLHPFWDTHYVFDKESTLRKKKMGKTMVDVIIINTIVPFMFLYGSHKDLEILKSNALTILESIPPEKNSIMEGWKKLDMNPSSAYETQALLQLKNEYCNKKRCMSCEIAYQILNT